jgi:Trk K+ transport system NAD-binding subunit
MEEIRLNTLTGGHFHEVHIESGSALEGKRIAEVVWPQEAIVAAVRRNSRILVPRGSTELLAGDYLTVVAARSADRALDDLARGKE